MRHHDIRHGLIVQRLPVAVVLRSDRDEARMVVLAALFEYEHHLSGVAGETLLGRPHDPFRFGFAVDRAVEHHHARELERVVEPRNVPAVGLVGDGRDPEAGDVGRYAVVGEHRFVVLVVDRGAQRPVGLFLERGVERQRAGLFGAEGRPVVVQQHVGRILGQPAARGVLVVEREERTPGVGHDFQKGVAEERFVVGQLVEQLAQRFAVAVDRLDEPRQQRRGRVADHALARYVVGLVVDDAPVGGRSARHECQRRGEEVVVAPAPETVALDGACAEGEIRVGAVADGQRRFRFNLLHNRRYLFVPGRCPRSQVRASPSGGRRAQRPTRR